MLRFSFYRPLICISWGLASHSALAALQPMAEAPLASDTELHCHFNRDASVDCTTPSSSQAAAKCSRGSTSATRKKTASN